MDYSKHSALQQGVAVSILLHLCAFVLPALVGMMTGRDSHDHVGGEKARRTITVALKQEVPRTLVSRSGRQREDSIESLPPTNPSLRMYPSVVTPLPRSSGQVLEEGGAVNDGFGVLTFDDYLPISLLSELPNALDSIPPLPSLFGPLAALGRIELWVLISSTGSVDDVLVVDTSMPPSITQFVREAFQRIRFSPGKIGRYSVRSRVRIIIEPYPDSEKKGGNRSLARTDAS